MTLLDPRTWPAQDVEELLALSSSLRGEAASARYDTACVVASTGPLASYAGRKALEAGGTAVDAALATAFTQIASAAGCWVSYAGLFTMVHFEAATGEVTSLNAGFRTFVEETDPATIPAAPEPSGRTALVPGFFAGAWAAHQRFGRLPWADLLAPAIWITEGVPLGESLGAMLAMREPVLQRTPEARAALLPDGTLPQVGDRFVQAELGATLRIVAERGIDHLYRGAWAQRFVDVVRREGGKARLADLSSYQPIWATPLTGEAYGVTLHGLGAPDTGGAALIEGLKVAQALGIGDVQTDPEALHLLVQVARASHTLRDVPPAERVSDEHAERVAKGIRETGRAPLPSAFSPGSHSDFSLAADAEGNVVAVCHSINTAAFGNTGIFIDGISIPDAASFQQPALAELEPGSPLPNPTNPTIVLRDGKPVLASSSIGAGLVETTLTCVHRHLAHGVPVEHAVSGVLVHGPDYGMAVTDSINNDGDGAKRKTQDLAVVIKQLLDEAEAEGGDPKDAWAMGMMRMPQSVTGPVDAEAVASHGSAVAVKADDEAAFLRGYWGGIAIDPATGALEGARTAFVNARVEGI
jgi:gamma-glutamyltranspeptidase/glutathione hydrolase